MEVDPADFPAPKLAENQWMDEHFARFRQKRHAGLVFAWVRTY